MKLEDLTTHERTDLPTVVGASIHEVDAAKDDFAVGDLVVEVHGAVQRVRDPEA